MISVEGDFVRTCCTGEDEFGIKRGNIGVLAGFVLFLTGIRNRNGNGYRRADAERGFKRKPGII